MNPTTNFEINFFLLKWASFLSKEHLELSLNFLTNKLNYRVLTNPSEIDRQSFVTQFLNKSNNLLKFSLIDSGNDRTNFTPSEAGLKFNFDTIDILYAYLPIYLAEPFLRQPSSIRNKLKNANSKDELLYLGLLSKTFPNLPYIFTKLFNQISIQLVNDDKVIRLLQFNEKEGKFTNKINPPATPYVLNIPTTSAI